MNTDKLRRLVGWIDNRRRPLLNIQFRHGKTVCALLDTGFNGYLLWEASETELSDFPGELSSLYESVEVADGNILVNLAWTNIQWLGDAAPDTGVETFVAVASKRRRPGDPSVLLGTALLAGTAVLVDFAGEMLRIEQPT
ncbi:MAG: hypothetical protein P8Y53_13445 [Pseudolabrys sp.]